MQVSARDEISIVNLSQLTKSDCFLLQTSKHSNDLNNFINKKISRKDKEWLIDLNSWKINNKWLLKVSDICLKEYEQVFFDYGDNLLDLKDKNNYQKFREKLIEQSM